MSLKLMYITNNEIVAQIAERSGVDWIFIDLEILGKEERQGHLNSVISRHHMEDIKRIKPLLKKAELLVRINPIFAGSLDEIDQAVDYGADIIMLPFFKGADEVETFIGYVDGRAKTYLLLETADAVSNIDQILDIEGIDAVHIGLNDLHLDYKMKFMFQPLADGTVDMLCEKLGAKKIPYGFGGIAQIGRGALPAEYIIAEHYRLGSSMAILSRSFCNANEFEGPVQLEAMFSSGVAALRDYEKQLSQEDIEFFESNHRRVIDKVAEITRNIEEK